MKLIRVPLFLALAAWYFGTAHAAFLVDPNTGGTPLWNDRTGADDEVKIGRSLGFAFSFFGGDPVTTIDVSVNGHLNFSGNSDYSNEIVPLPILRISPLFDDLRVLVGSGDAVIEKVSSGKYYSVTWRAHEGGQPATRHAFQVVLFGTATRVNGVDFLKDDIVFAYAEIGPTFAKDSATVGLDSGDAEIVLPLPGARHPGGQLQHSETGLLPLGAGGFVLYRFDGSDSYSVSVFGNRPPRARSDTFYTTTRAVVRIPALANDDDPDLEPVSVEHLSAPGFGTVTPLADGVLRYVPGPGFKGRDEFIYTIRDPAGLTATARVSIVPFAPNKGTFEGFLSDAPTEDEPIPELTPEGAGFIRLTMRPNGTFSSKVIYGGYRASLVGRFDAQGNFETSFQRIVDEETQTVTLSLHLDLLHETQPLSGRITQGESSSLIAGARSLHRAGSAPAPQAGLYKVLLFPDENGEGPAGIGYANLRISPGGTAKLAGKLGNGRVLAASGSVKPDGTFPFYLHLPGLPGGRAGAFWGRVKFDDTDPTCDCTAAVRWFMPETKSGSEFDAAQTLVGDRHAPLAGRRVLALSDEPKNATIDVGGEYLETLTIDLANKVTVEEGGDEKLVVTIKPAKGKFSGSFVEESFEVEGVFKKRKLSGMFLTKRNMGGGLYLDAEGLAAPVVILPLLPEPE